MIDTDSRLALTLDEAAASAERVFLLAGGKTEPGDWLRVAIQAAWMADHGFEGTSGEVARILHRSYLNLAGDIVPAMPDSKPWQAVARHLHYLVTDTDQNEDLAELEARWTVSEPRETV